MARKVRGYRPEWAAVILRPAPRRWSAASVALFGTREACRRFADHHEGDPRYFFIEGSFATEEQALSEYLSVMDCLPPFMR